MRERNQMHQKRQYIYDYIRVISCICIIGVHVTAGWTSNIGGIAGDIEYSLHALFRIGLPMFTILSGALILNSIKNESIGMFYYKRIVRIVIPFIIASVFYVVWVNERLSFSYLYVWANWVTLIKQIPYALFATMQTYQATHLWYVYFILGIYLVAPFFKIMTQNMTVKQQKEFVVLILVMRSVYEIAPLFDMQVGVNYFVFSSGIMYFMLGYILTQEWVRKYDILIWVCGVISYIISVSVYLYFPSYITAGIWDESPLMIFQASAVFILFYRNREYICRSKTANKVVGIISKHTFSMYLIHEYIRQLVAGWTIWGDAPQQHRIIVAISMIMIIFVLSFIVAYIMDNTILKLLQKMLYKPIAKFEASKLDFPRKYEWENVKNKKWVWLVICLIGIVMMISIVRTEGAYEEEIIMPEATMGYDYVQMEKDKVLTQKFIISKNRDTKLSSISTILVNVSEDDKEGSFCLKILDDRGTVKYDKDYSIKDFVIGDYQEIMLDKPLKLKKNREYEIQIEFKNTNIVPYLLLQDLEYQNRYNTICMVDEDAMDNTLVVGYRYYGVMPNIFKFILCLLILIMMLHYLYYFDYLSNCRKFQSMNANFLDN